MSNAGTVKALTNNGTISGGIGGRQGGTGGAGVRANSGQTINLLSNAAGAKISGGMGGPFGFGDETIRGGNPAGGRSSFGAGGAGIANSGTINTLTNRGTISGGAGGLSSSGVFAARAALESQISARSRR